MCCDRAILCCDIVSQTGKILCRERGFLGRYKVGQGKGKLCRDKASLCCDRVGQNTENFCRDRGLKVSTEQATIESSVAHDRAGHAKAMHT